MQGGIRKIAKETSSTLNSSERQVTPKYTIQGIETIQAIYKHRRSLQPDSVFSAYNKFQQLLATS
ncbi:Uncharacterized protein BWINRASL_00913 [Bacillus mycoides]|nr:Uncharacterized protein BWINRASL_00913 [Bacillus mycoides]